MFEITICDLKLFDRLKSARFTEPIVATTL